MKRVAVLRGGPSDEYAVSMETGKSALRALASLGYKHKDIVITRTGEWLEGGFVKQPFRALEGIDVVFLALHGSYGEDGQIQRLLEQRGIPYTGSKALPSAIAFNKELTKRTLLQHGVKMPRHRRVVRDELDNLDEAIPLIFSDVGTELFIKPLTSGSSIGARHVPNEAVLREALIELLAIYDQVLVEEFIQGKEATVAVLDNFRNERSYILPVIEIVPPSGESLFSHENKYNGLTEEIVPGRFSYQEKCQLSDIAALVHKAIDCRQYSRSDFIVKDGEVYFLEVNTLPGLTDESLFPKAAASVGLDYNMLIQHLVESAEL